MFQDRSLLPDRGRLEVQILKMHRLCDIRSNFRGSPIYFVNLYLDSPLSESDRRRLQVQILKMHRLYEMRSNFGGSPIYQS